MTSERGLAGGFNTNIVKLARTEIKRLRDAGKQVKILTIGKKISPVNHVTDDDPPTLIIHGDADKLVPIQQAELIIDKLKQANVPCELVVKPGAAHGWAGMDKDIVTLADWFDKHLQKK